MFRINLFKSIKVLFFIYLKWFNYANEAFLCLYYSIFLSWCIFSNIYLEVSPSTLDFGKVNSQDLDLDPLIKSKSECVPGTLADI